MQNLRNKVRMDELPEPYRTLARDIGRDAALRLAERYGGQQVYFPRVVDRVLRDIKIRREYTGYNATELAKKYGISERQVRRIAKARR